MPALPPADALRTSLRRDLLDRWFPACLDPDGGYRQNFDADFLPTDDAAKGLVFQARMVWVCATLAEERPEYAAYARHGVRFLRDRLLDRRTGAFRWSTEGGEERHAYGLAFAVFGLAAAARHLGDEDALELAKGACTYLEAYHADGVYGGYFEATDASGNPILEGGDEDAIGTPRGQKSQNTHLHLLEAYTELLRAWPDPLVRERLAHLRDVLTLRLLTPSGSLTLFTERDWTPASTERSYGHDIEAAHLLLDAEAALNPLSSSGERGHVLALADHTLLHGEDPEGGLFNLGDAQGPTDRSKVWWVQAEALLGFAALWRATGDPKYRDALARTWAFIDAHQIDHARGGWFEEASGRERPKGHAWKAAYHDGRALLFTERLLRTPPENE